jgi:magnesium chelatase family protein
LAVVTVYSSQLIGLGATIISVEVDLSPGLHLFAIVGLAEKAVQESRERIGSAIRNIGARPPHKKSERLIVNLAPADIRKEGPAFDLSIALGFLLASGQAKFEPKGKLLAGELGLDGSVKPISGTLAMAMAGRLAGFDTIYVPLGNGLEAALVEGIAVKEVDTLTAILDDLEERRLIQPLAKTSIPKADRAGGIDLGFVRGQEQAKRCLEIAAAGGHNLLMSGPPGTGKTLLARAITGILPAMTPEEIIEVTNIYSVAGALRSQGAIVSERPFRNPHHTASAVAIAGGGSPIRPGEITLAHRGVLFLDELPEFPGHLLDTLRQPLEDRTVHVARATGAITFPADFMLVAAMNPCPCGNLSHPTLACICTPGAIARYRRRISGPLLDRIDPIIEVGAIDAEKISAEETSLPSESAAIRERVELARERQRRRFGRSGTATNSAMSLPEIKTFCRLDENGRAILRQAYERLGLSARSYYRLIKISRTIADLEGSGAIRSDHLAEAIQYRPRVEV